MRFKPKFDKLFLFIWIPCAVLILGLLILTAIDGSVGGWTILAFTALFVAYFLISPCFGYVELRETAVFIKFGFFLKKEIPYEKIRATEKKHTAIADSMLSLKNALDHVNIKYGSFDVTSVSVLDEDTMISELHARCGIPTKTDI